MRRIKQSGSYPQRGTSFVDFAIVAPVLFSVLFGVIDMALGFFATQRVTFSAWKFARSASLKVPMTNHSAGLMERSIREELTFLRYGTDYHVVVSPPADDPADQISDKMVSVRIDGAYPYFFLSAMGIRSKPIAVNIKMRYEAQPVVAPPG